MLILETEIIKIKGPIGVGAAKAYVDGKLVTQAELTLQLVRRRIYSRFIPRTNWKDLAA